METSRPALLTSRGRGVAVVQSLTEHERLAEERRFMRAVIRELVDPEAGRDLALSEVKKRLRLR